MSGNSIENNLLENWNGTDILTEIMTLPGLLHFDSFCASLSKQPMLKCFIHEVKGSDEFFPIEFGPCYSSAVGARRGYSPRVHGQSSLYLLESHRRLSYHCPLTSSQPRL